VSNEGIAIKRNLDDKNEYELTDFSNGTVPFVGKDGFSFEGTLISGKRSGLGTIYHYHGQRDINWYTDDEPRGHGVRLNKDVTHAWRLFDGQVYSSISVDAAMRIIEALEIRARRSSLVYDC